VAARRDGRGEIAIGDAVEMRARLVQRPQHRTPQRQPDQHGQERSHPQQTGRGQDHALQRAARAGHCGLAPLPRVDLVGVRALHIGRARRRQRLLHDAVGLDAVPTLDRLVQRRQRAIGETAIGRQHPVEQRPAVGVAVRVGAQPPGARGRLRQQRLRLGQVGVARLLHAAFHGRLGVGQGGARLEQAAGRLGQIAGALDAAAPQRLDLRAIVPQDRNARRGSHREQHHEHRQGGRHRRRDLEIPFHVHPSRGARAAGVMARIMDIQFGNFLTHSPARPAQLSPPKTPY